MHIALLGASKGIGAHVLRNILGETDATVTLLLRKPGVFDNDDLVAPTIKAGRVRVVEGDATKEVDLERVFERKVEVVVTSVGERPLFPSSTTPTRC